MFDVTYMDKYISDGKKETISLRNLYQPQLIGNHSDPDYIFKVPFHDFFLEHREELKDCMALYQVPETRFYKPKLVSLEIYGTTELWLALLRVNNMRNISEFHYPLIKIYEPNKLFNYINIFFKRAGITS